VPLLQQGVTPHSLLLRIQAQRAQRQVYRQLTEGLTDLQRTQLKALLTVPAASRQTILVWLRQPPGAASPSNFQKVIERLEWIHSLSLDPQVASQVHQERAFSVLSLSF
jgi:hypothetical protein